MLYDNDCYEKRNLYTVVHSSNCVCVYVHYAHIKYILQYNCFLFIFYIVYRIKVVRESQSRKKDRIRNKEQKCNGFDLISVL